MLRLPVFFETILTMVECMICQDGKYAGYTPIFQGDNAGPDQDSKFLNGVKGKLALADSSNLDAPWRRPRTL